MARPGTAGWSIVRVGFGAGRSGACPRLGIQGPRYLLSCEPADRDPHRTATGRSVVHLQSSSSIELASSDTHGGGGVASAGDADDQAANRYRRPAFDHRRRPHHHGTGSHHPSIRRLIQRDQDRKSVV